VTGQGVGVQVVALHAHQGAREHRVFWQLSNLYEERGCGDERLWWLTKDLDRWIAGARKVIGRGYSFDLDSGVGESKPRRATYFKLVPTPFMLYLLLRWGLPSIRQRRGEERPLHVVDALVAHVCRDASIQLRKATVLFKGGRCSGLRVAGTGDGDLSVAEALLACHGDWCGTLLSKEASQFFWAVCGLLDESVILGELPTTPFDGNATLRRPRKAREPLDPDLANALEVAAVAAGPGTAQRFVEAGRQLGIDVPDCKRKAAMMKARAYFLATRQAMGGSCSDAIAFGGKRFAGRHWLMGATMRTDSGLSAWTVPQALSIQRCYGNQFPIQFWVDSQNAGTCP